MRILRFNRIGEPHSVARLGVMVGDGFIAHLRACYAKYLEEVVGDTQAREIAALRFPPHVAPFLQIGKSGWDAIETIRPWIDELAAKTKYSARGLDQEEIFVRFEDCYVHIATRPPSKLICVRWADHHDVSTPPLVIKPNSSVMGPQRKIAKPPAAAELTAETLLGIVISKKCKNVGEENALDVVAGYTVVNDLSARDVERAGRNANVFGLGDLFDTFTSIGPWLATKDEVTSPNSLRLITRINQEGYRNAPVGVPQWPIEKLIAFASRTTLEPGDLIAIGGRAPTDSGLRFLTVGDIVECEIPTVGKIEAAVEVPGVKNAH